MSTRQNHAWAQMEARRLFGWLGVAVRRGAACQVGRFTRDPRVAPPPWPIEVFGEAPDWAAAVAQADREARHA
jgi:hypothetical protein